MLYSSCSEKEAGVPSSAKAVLVRPMHAMQDRYNHGAASPQRGDCCVRMCALGVHGTRRVGRLDKSCPTYLAGRVDDLGRIVLALEPDDLAEGVLYRGVVAFDEVPVDKLNGERRFAYTVEPASPATRSVLCRSHRNHPQSR